MNGKPKLHVCPDCLGEGMHIGPIYDGRTFYGMIWFSCVWCVLGYMDEETLRHYQNTVRKSVQLAVKVTPPAAITSFMN